MPMPPIPIMPEFIPIEPCIAIGLVIAITVTAGLVLDLSYQRLTVTSSLPVTKFLLSARYRWCPCRWH
jgi:hypothetical protein